MGLTLTFKTQMNGWENCVRVTVQSQIPLNNKIVVDYEIFGVVYEKTSATIDLSNGVMSISPLSVKSYPHNTTEKIYTKIKVPKYSLIQIKSYFDHE